MKKYDSYKESGIEWVGVIPQHWNYKRFKYCFDLVSEKSNEDLPKLGLENIESWTGKYLRTKGEFEGDGEVFQVDDILYGKLRPYLAKVFLSSFSGKAVGDIFVFRSKNELVPGYGHKLILSKPFIDITNSSTFGSKMPRVSWEFISNLEIPIPLESEQIAIANYLDRKTTEIDQLISDKKALVELYKEERTAIINQAVTKGTNHDAPMKESGIECLGKIPKHWEVKKLKYVVSKVGSGVTPKGGASVYKKEGIPLLRSQNIYSDGFRLDNVAFIAEEVHDKMVNSKVLKNDVLLNITGASIGRVYYVSSQFEDANVNQHVCIIRPIISIINSDFLYYLLRSKIGQSQISLEQTGSNREGLNFEVLKNFNFPIMDKEEQINIVCFIENESKNIDLKILEAEKYLALLSEYRTTLISEVVTGKVKVTVDI